MQRQARLLACLRRDVYFFNEIFAMPGHTERICELMLARGVRLRWTSSAPPTIQNVHAYGQPRAVMT